MVVQVVAPQGSPLEVPQEQEYLVKEILEALPVPLMVAVVVGRVERADLARQGRGLLEPD